MSDPETEIKGPKVKEHLKKADMEKLKEIEDQWEEVARTVLAG